ncbi:terminase large subunit [Microcystis phage Mae-Yong1326-1]|nr:terminase large subunit [Microcystis phage Mae-Yong1326-1]
MSKLSTKQVRAQRQPPSEDERLERILERLVAAEDAQDNLLAFARLMRPDPNDVDDVARSIYQPAKHHKAIAHALHELEAGRIRRLIINCPPRHGKTELASKLFLPWYLGRNPANSAIFATYNEKYSWDIGAAVREVIQSPAYGQVFPDVSLSAASVDKLVIRGGGQLSMAGRGGSVTGRGGDLLVVDDPLKDRKEANSPAIRQQLWEWWSDTFKSRMMTDQGRILLIQTRWHSDDLVGRLTDPNNEFYDAEQAKGWHIVDLPALAEENDPLGRQPGEALWPERFSKEWLEEQRRGNAFGFAALYQGRPQVQGGNHFQEGWLWPYSARDLPPLDTLRIYIASDHAVSMSQDRDKTCLLPVGVDHTGTTWVLPDVWWRRAPPDVVVEAMLLLIRKYKPLAWWAERTHIKQSIGPFLRKRMLETSTFCAIHEMTPVADKLTRSQSIQGRMAMKRVRFPNFTAWWPEARNEMLSFPAGAHDDFVDALSYIGLGLDLQVPGQIEKPDAGPKQGTFGWLKEQTRQQERERALRLTGGF